MRSGAAAAWSCGPASRRTSRPGCSRAAPPRSSGSTATTTARVHLGVTSTTTRPGADARDRPLPVFFPPEVEVVDMKRILVAGIGNAWLRDDGFGGEVAKRLEQRELPEGAVVLDFGTGGLDLAYEVMRGYDALVLVDVSRQGGEPGTLYVMEAARGGGRGGHRGRPGDQPARDGPADGAALRQDGRRLARQGRGRRLRAGEVEEMGLGPERRGGAARWTAPSSSCVETVERARRPTPRTRWTDRCTSCRSSGAIVNTVVKHAAGRRVTRRDACASARCARWCRTRSSSTSASSRGTRCARARGSSRS